MQPRDFGYRMSDTKFTNKDLAEGGDGVLCTQMSMSFKKLTAQNRREQPTHIMTEKVKREGTYLKNHRGMKLNI